MSTLSSTDVNPFYTNTEMHLEITIRIPLFLDRIRLDGTANHVSLPLIRFRALLSPLSAFRLQGCYLLWRPVPWPSSTCRFCNSSSTPVHAHAGPTTPIRQRHRAVTPMYELESPPRVVLFGFHATRTALT
jgi:hypothetical protein